MDPVNGFLDRNTIGDQFRDHSLDARHGHRLDGEDALGLGGSSKDRVSPYLGNGIGKAELKFPRIAYASAFDVPDTEPSEDRAHGHHAIGDRH